MNTYQATFISDILLYDCRNLKCNGMGRDRTDGRTDGQTDGRTEGRPDVNLGSNGYVVHE